MSSLYRLTLLLCAAALSSSESVFPPTLNAVILRLRIECTGLRAHQLYRQGQFEHPLHSQLWDAAHCKDMLADRHIESLSDPVAEIERTLNGYLAEVQTIKAKIAGEIAIDEEFFFLNSPADAKERKRNRIQCKLYRAEHNIIVDSSRNPVRIEWGLANEGVRLDWKLMKCEDLLGLTPPPPVESTSSEENMTAENSSPTQPEDDYVFFAQPTQRDQFNDIPPFRKINAELTPDEICTRCTYFFKLYHIQPEITWGNATDEVKMHWSELQCDREVYACQFSEESADVVTAECENIAAKYGDGSKAPVEVRAMWDTMGCSRRVESAWEPLIDEEWLDDSPAKPRAPNARANSTSLQWAKTHMRNSSIVIVGLVQSIEPNLKRVIRTIEATGELFADYRVILFENDSKDKTRQRLLEWSQKNWRVYVKFQVLNRRRAGAGGYSVVQEGEHKGKEERLVWLSEYRNAYMEALETPEYRNFSYVLVFDTDIPGWRLSSVGNTFAWNDWDMVCANGRMGGIMKDAFAFRNDEFPEIPKESPTYWQNTVNRIQLAFGSDFGGPRIPVTSCFGGMAIYRLDAMTGCRYDGADCEHVVLHDCMRKKGATAMFFNPGMHIINAD